MSVGEEKPGPTPLAATHLSPRIFPVIVLESRLSFAEDVPAVWAPGSCLCKHSGRPSGPPGPAAGDPELSRRLLTQGCEAALGK